MEKSTKKKDVKRFFRRYWYWFLTIPVLIAVSFVWMYFIGVFDKPDPVELSTNTPKMIEMTVNSTYRMAVTSNSDRKPVYSSSRPYVVEVDSDGFLISHDEGTAVVTADFGIKKYQVAVSVSPCSLTWYLTTGDVFTQADVYRAFAGASTELQSFSLDGNDNLKIGTNETTGEEEYTIVGDISETVKPVYVAVGAPSKKDEYVFSTKGVLIIYLVPTLEEKVRKTDEYNRSLDKKPPVIPNRVDEELTIDCGYNMPVRPKLTTEGYVTYYLQGLPGDFPVALDQRGSVRVDAMTDEFYLTAVSSSGETWRWKCSATPRSAPVYVSVGQEFVINEYRSTIPNDVVRLDSPSVKLEAVYDEDGLHGYRALEVTEDCVYVNGYSDDSDYITFRFNVYINNDAYVPTEE